MKKLLSILALVLVVCTLCAIALADENDSVKPAEVLSRIHDMEKDGEHQMAGEPWKVADATCTAGEIWRFNCSVDNFIHEVIVGDGLGHDWVKKSQDPDPAVCGEDVTITYECSRCGETKEETVVYEHIWASESGERDWGIVYKEPTCFPDEAHDFGWGWAADYCLRCRQLNWYDPENADNSKDDKNTYVHRDIAPVDHQYTTYYFDCEPTCATGNISFYISACTICGEFETGDVASLDPEEVFMWAKDFAPELIHSVKGAANVYKLNPDWEFNNWSHLNKEDHTCATYDTYKNQHDGDGHWWDEWGYEDEEPDETKVGYKCASRKAFRGCKLCAEKETKDVIPEAKWVKLNITAQKVLDEDIKQLINCYQSVNIMVCENCFDFAAFEADGSKALNEYCTVHGWYPVTVEGTPAHDYDWANPVEYIAPTCTEPGHEKFVCIHKDEDARHDDDPTTYTEWDIDPVGHIYGEWILRVPQNANGGKNEYAYWLHECLVCGQTEERLFNGEGTPTDLDSKVHEYELDEDMSSDPTCEDNGNLVYVNPNDEEDVIVREIAALGHNLETKTVPATCEAAGSITTYCTRCDYIKVDVIPATGHTIDPEKRIVLAEPDCINPGKALDICTECKKSFESEISALGHDFGEEVVIEAATCVKDGKAEKTCTVCGEKEEVVIPKLNADGVHTYSPKEAKAATCTEDGYTVSVTCDVCGDVMVPAEVIPALDHDYVETEGKPATCTEDGKTAEIKCDRCGDVKQAAEVILAEGHKWDEGKETKAATYTEAAEWTYTCTECGATETRTKGEPKELEDAAYTVESVAVSGGVITGKLAHVENTKDAQVYVRVTAYFGSDHQCGIWEIPVNADGTFVAQVNGATGVDVAFTFTAGTANQIVFDAFDTRTVY